MCSPGNKTPLKPELPPVPWDIDDPLAFVPTDLRPEHQDSDLGHCRLCGHPASQDELNTNGGTHAGFVDEDGTRHQLCPTLMPIKPRIKHRARFSVDRPAVKVIMPGPNHLKGPEL